MRQNIGSRPINLIFKCQSGKFSEQYRFTLARRSFTWNISPWYIQQWTKFIFRHFGIDLIIFEVCGLFRILYLFWIEIQKNSKIMRSAPKCRRIMFGPSLDAPWSKVSNALRMNSVRQKFNHKTILSKNLQDWHLNLKSIGRDPIFWSIQRLQSSQIRLKTSDLQIESTDNCFKINTFHLTSNERRTAHLSEMYRIRRRRLKCLNGRYKHHHA